MLVFSVIQGVLFYLQLADINLLQVGVAESDGKTRYQGFPSLSVLYILLAMIDNWNKLFLLSETEYVVMLHDDDVLFSNFLSEMDRVAAMTPKFVTINAEKLSWDGNKIPNVKKKLSGKSLRVYKYSKYSNFAFFHFGAPSGCLFNKKQVLELGGFDNAAYPSSDYVFIQKLCMSKGMVLKSKAPLMLYWVAQNTTSQIQTKQAWLDIDYRIKEELAEKLHIPSSIKDLIEYFEIKIQLRGIAKVIPNYSYDKWSPGGSCFLVFFKVYRYITNTYINFFCRVNLDSKKDLIILINYEKWIDYICYPAVINLC